jgi:gliding motility-associated-like protein
MVTLIARTGCGYDSLSRQVYVNPLPEVNFATERYACEGQATQFLNRSNEQAAFRWDFGDGQIDSLSYSPKHVYRSGGRNATVTLNIKDFPNGCENSISKPLLVRSRPVANFAINGDSTGCAPFTVVLQNLSRGANRWEWDFGNGQTSNLENPGTVFDIGDYDITLVASYENVCKDTFRLDDAVTADECGVFIPNAFSPNGDGQNDFFTLYGGQFSATKIRTMRVYTRWGEMVFEKENFDMDNLSGWDGSIKGRAPIPGVYVYWIEIEQLGGRTKTYKGDVTLIR